MATEALDVNSGPGGRLFTAPISQGLGFLVAKLHAAASVLNNEALAGFGLKDRGRSRRPAPT